MSGRFDDAQWSVASATDPHWMREVRDQRGHAVSWSGGFPVEDAHAYARLIAQAPKLLAIAKRLALATDEGDDKAQGTHYVNDTGVIRCKGSFLALIEDARAAVGLADPE